MCGGYYVALALKLSNVYFKVIIASIMFKELFGLDIKYILHKLVL